MPEKHQTPSLQGLLDENVDRLLKSHFHSDFEIVTVPEQGWAGLGDGEDGEEVRDILEDIPSPHREEVEFTEGASLLADQYLQAGVVGRRAD